MGDIPWIDPHSGSFVLGCCQLVFVSLGCMYMGSLMVRRVFTHIRRRAHLELVCIIRRRISEHLDVMLTNLEASHLYSVHQEEPTVGQDVTNDSFNVSFSLSVGREVWSSMWRQYMVDGIDLFLGLYQLALLTEADLADIAVSSEAEWRHRWGRYLRWMTPCGPHIVARITKQVYTEYWFLLLGEYTNFYLMLRRISRNHSA